MRLCINYSALGNTIIKMLGSYIYHSILLSFDLVVTFSLGGGACWELAFTPRKYIFRFGHNTHPHTTHTYTRIFGASFPLPGGGYSPGERVCVLLQRAFTSDKPACSLRFAFSILKFTYRS